ncbi:MAG: MBL fold metallo-hydrolase, partial [Candidatus Hermodarchaeota archaeon]
MEIEIYGGIKEIGGNKILTNINDKRFLFDFGLSFNDNNKYFSEFLSPRKLNGIVDYLYLGLIPSFNNFYRNDLLSPFTEILKKESYNITPSDNNMVDACFLTHAHLDHYKFIGFLKKTTPIYMNWI